MVSRSKRIIHSSPHIFVLFTCIFVGLTIIIQSNFTGEFPGNFNIPQIADSALISSEPIEITGDASLDMFPNKTGEGNFTHPYIISNLLINAPTGNADQSALKISQTTKHLIIQNCTFVGRFLTIPLIQFLDSSNITLQNCSISDAKPGLSIEHCTSLLIQRCLFESNDIALDISTETGFCTIRENIFIGNKDLSASSEDNSVEVNIQSPNNTFYGNEFIRTTVLDRGFYFYDYSENPEEPVFYSNSWDFGGKGNYWSDYRNKYPDAKANGDVWDTAYVIFPDVQDNYPLVLPPFTPNSDDPPTRPSFDSDNPLFVVILGLVAVLFIGGLFLVKRRSDSGEMRINIVIYLITIWSIMAAILYLLGNNFQISGLTDVLSILPAFFWLTLVVDCIAIFIKWWRIRTPRFKSVEEKVAYRTKKLEEKEARKKAQEKKKEEHLERVKQEEEARRLQKEQDLVKKFKQLVLEDEVPISRFRKALNMSEKAFYDDVGRWGPLFGFKINDKLLVFPERETRDFLENIERVFAFAREQEQIEEEVTILPGKSKKGSGKNLSSGKVLIGGKTVSNKKGGLINDKK